MARLTVRRLVKASRTLAAVAAAVVSAGAQAGGACNRDCLIAITESYTSAYAWTCAPQS
jgi:hypothetical protein